MVIYMYKESISRYHHNIHTQRRNGRKGPEAFFRVCYITLLTYIKIYVNVKNKNLDIFPTMGRVLGQATGLDGSIIKV